MPKFTVRVIVEKEITLSQKDVKEAFEEMANQSRPFKIKKKKKSRALPRADAYALLDAANDLGLVELPEMGDSVYDEVIDDKGG